MLLRAPWLRLLPSLLWLPLLLLSLGLLSTLLPLLLGLPLLLLSLGLLSTLLPL
ncbi:MAG: hypothetical protein NTW28_37690 [Candidatus Solibacter sp.]|nr:hypothetical protein [Candidatus Solibacter sp.]